MAGQTPRPWRKGADANIVDLEGRFVCQCLIDADVDFILAAVRVMDLLLAAYSLNPTAQNIEEVRPAVAGLMREIRRTTAPYEAKQETNITDCGV